MSVVDEAAQVIHEWLQEHFSITQDTGNPRDIAQRIADAGLLAEDRSPQPPTGLEPCIESSEHKENVRSVEINQAIQEFLHRPRLNGEASNDHIR